MNTVSIIQGDAFFTGRPLQIRSTQGRSHNRSRCRRSCRWHGRTGSLLQVTELAHLSITLKASPWPDSDTLQQLNLINYFYQFSLRSFFDIFDYILRHNPNLKNVMDHQSSWDILLEVKASWTSANLLQCQHPKGNEIFFSCSDWFHSSTK